MVVMDKDGFPFISLKDMQEYYEMLEQYQKEHPEDLRILLLAERAKVALERQYAERRALHRRNRIRLAASVQLLSVKWRK